MEFNAKENEIKLGLDLNNHYKKHSAQIQNGQITAVSRAEFFRKRLQEYEQENIQGKQVRCRSQWIESGETSGKFFTAKENIKGTRDCITELNYQGKRATDTNACLHLTQTFYTDLYREQPIDDETSVQALSHLNKQLTCTDSFSCEGPLTLVECTESLKTLHASKSPGMDGLTTEFYRAFWSLLRDDFVQWLTQSKKRPLFRIAREPESSVSYIRKEIETISKTGVPSAF